MKVLEPGACFVCRRRECGLGIGKDPRVGWLCAVCEADGIGPRAIRASDRRFDACEDRALASAGEAAGAYLDGLGRTDLAALHPDEFRHFCRLVVDEFGCAIRREISNG